MDFTYIIGGVLAGAIGFATKAAFLILRRSDERLLPVAFGIALLVNLALLIDWRELPHSPLLILVFDAVAIPVATLVGVVMGILPLLILAGLWRKLFGRSPR